MPSNRERQVREALLGIVRLAYDNESKAIAAGLRVFVEQAYHCIGHLELQTEIEQLLCELAIDSARANALAADLLYQANPSTVNEAYRQRTLDALTEKENHHER